MKTIEKLTDEDRDELFEANYRVCSKALRIIDQLTAALEAAERESARRSSTAAAWQDQLLELRETVDAFEKARKRLTSKGGAA